MNRTYTSIAIDDERPALKLISAYIDKMPYLELIHSYESPISLLQALPESNVDILFLDIQMKDMTGMQLIKLLENKPQIIITTAYRKYAIKGFELKVTDYLIKPFSFDRFVEATQTAIKNIDLIEQALKIEDAPENNTIDHFFVRTNHKLEKVIFDEIKYIESMREYVSIYTSERRFIVNTSMIKILQELPKKQFIRIHRSHIINMNLIEYINGNQISISGNKFTIGASYKEKFFELIHTI